MNIDPNFIANLRQDYRQKTLDISDVLTNPLEQFKIWFEETLKATILEPNAMILATADAKGRPSARTVLLKGYNKDGFLFYTNYESRKGKELAENPYASLVFLWLPLQRQIRIEGKVEKVSAAISDNYYHSRPKGSQIGAVASPQSQVIANRSVLEKNVARLNEQYKEAEQIPRPENWGGYRIVPTTIEFWQGRSSRLHDRLQYKRQIDGSWKIERLAP